MSLRIKAYKRTAPTFLYPIYNITAHTLSCHDIALYNLRKGYFYKAPHNFSLQAWVMQIFPFRVICNEYIIHSSFKPVNTNKAETELLKIKQKGEKIES